MNKTWIVIITIIITAVVTAGGAYYCLNNKAEKEKAELQTQIDELKDHIDQLERQILSLQKADSDSTSTTTTTDKTADWKTYTNAKYGFTLTFNDIWKNYEFISKDVDDGGEDTLYACIPTKSTIWNDIKPGVFCPFAISIIKISEWDTFQSLNDPIIPTEIGRNSSYIFAESPAQDNPEDGSAAMGDINNIIETFSIN